MTNQANDDNLLRVRFINQIKGSENERYYAILMVNSVGTQTLYANEDYTDFGPVPKTGQDFVTAIYVKNPAGFDIAQGAAYFAYDAAKPGLIVSMINLPRGMTLEDKDNNEFDLTITEIR